jgi:hypothetical protein
VNNPSVTKDDNHGERLHGGSSSSLTSDHRTSIPVALPGFGTLRNPGGLRQGWQ